MQSGTTFWVEGERSCAAGAVRIMSAEKTVDATMTAKVVPHNKLLKSLFAFHVICPSCLIFPAHYTA